MNNLVLYLLQSGISLALFYLIYWLFLRKDTFFMINRFYLVCAVLFALVFPLLGIKFAVDGPVNPYIVMLDAITVSAAGIESTVRNHLNTFQIIGVIYLTGVVIFFIRFLIQVLQLAGIVRKYGISREQGLNLVFTDRNFAPFSFFNLIFINRKKLNKEDLREIIEHEQVHISQRHSIDLLLLEILTIIQWFNPFVWFYRHSLKSIHEYLADEGVLLRGYDPVNYQKLLVQQSTGLQLNELTNNFNHSLIKNRILMMTKNKSTFLSKLKVALVTPVAFTLIAAFTATPVAESIAQVEQSAKQIQTQKAVAQSDQEEVIFTVVEEMPKFPGGEDARIKYMISNLTYPETARKAKKEGTVYVTFVVEKDGSISNARVLRGFDEACDKVALDAIRNMPAWTPGKQRGKPVRVQFNMPVKFSLEKEKKVEKDHRDAESPPPPPKKEKK